MKINKLNTILIIITLTLACTEQGEIGSSINQSNVEVISLDTFTLNISTVILDSIVTSGSNQVLVGSYLDDRVGRLTSTSYFQIGLPSTSLGDFRESAVLDSICLILPYNYYSGDTTVPFTLSVHALEEAIEYGEDAFALYNTNAFAFDTNPLTSYSFSPRPNRAKSLELRLPDELGNTWLSLLIENADIFDDLENFQDFFPGLVLTADSINGHCTLGFRAIGTTNDDNEATSSTFIRMYYQESGEGRTLDFPLTNSSLQFNQITNDRRNTILADLEAQKQALSSEQTENEAYIQAGVGLVTRVEIPYIDRLLELGNTSATMYAELIIRPVNNTFDIDKLPVSLNFFSSDQINRVGSSLEFNSRVGLDAEFDESTFYSFDITNYILAELNQDEFTDNVFLLTLPAFSSTVERLVLGDGDHPTNPMQLRVIITRFN